MNEVTAMYKPVKFDILEEYEVEYLSFVLQTFLAETNTNINDFVYGKGKKKSQNSQN